jgi:hypothetical protein
MTIQSSENRLTIAKGDTLLALAATLKDSLGNVYDLRNATVTFRMVHYYTGVIKVNNRPAQIRQNDGVPSTYGQVAYLWADGETDEPGIYQGWFIITKSGKSNRFPPDGDLYILIQEVR